MIKWIFLSLLGCILLIYAFNFKLINYGLRQLKGQLYIITHTQPVEEILAQPNFPDSLKAKIKLIEEIKKFTVDSLGLKPSGSYQTYYDQHGEPIIWVITACPPYSLEPKKWDFPVAGVFSYKGFFNKEMAMEEAKELKEEGFDVRLGEISAWSTLGYMNDPILSSMLERSDGQLAALLIHELTHGTLFVKNNLEFNENLADFVGDEGAKLFLKSKYGEQSEGYIDYAESKAFNDAYSKLMVNGTKRLNKLFQTFSPKMSSYDKDSLKYALIGEIMRSAEKLPFKKNKMHYLGKGSVNNAYFTAYSTYQARQNEFREELELKFNGNFKRYLNHLKGKYSSLGS